MEEDTPLNTEEDKQARIWGMLCHLTALLGMIGIPLGNVLGPLINGETYTYPLAIRLIKK